MSNPLSVIHKAIERARRIRSKAGDEVQALCDYAFREGGHGWRMSIPARPGEDSDLIIADALDADPWEALAVAVEALAGIWNTADGCQCDNHASEQCCIQADAVCRHCESELALQQIAEKLGGEK
jgi:hypothetical protein